MALIFPLIIGLAALAAGESVSRQGMTLGGVDQNLATLLDLPEASGAIVLNIEAGSLAAQAGFLKRDVLIAAGGKPTADPLAVAAAIDAVGVAGGDLAIEFWRGGEKKTLTLKIPAPAPNPPAVGAVTTGIGAIAPPELTASESDRQTIRQVIKTLNENHYSGHPLDDEIAERTLGLFIDALDAGKWYLTQQDVDGLLRRASTLDDQLAAGDFSLAFEAYRTFFTRLAERIALAEKLLEEPVDFQVDEALPGMGAAFVRNEAEARETWRKRVKYELLIHKSAGADDTEARKRALRSFRDTLDSFRRQKTSDVVGTVADSLAHAYDAQSTFIPPPQLATYESNMTGQLVGVGMQLQMRSGYVNVIKVIAGGPAAKEGSLKAGDRLIAVAQGEAGEFVEIVGVQLNDAIKLLRGAKGSQVRLKYLPAGEFEASFCTLTRDTVVFTRLAERVLTGAELPEGRRAKVGYLFMPLFYRAEGKGTGAREGSLGVTGEVKKRLEDFRSQGVDLVVLDLRDNSGGPLNEAINFCGLFLGSSGTITQVKGRDGKVLQYSPDNIEQAWNGPLVVLTSRGSAGGAEIVAGAIQDSGRGLVIGDLKTHGVGEVGSMFSLKSPDAPADAPSLGEMKVVTQKFYRPAGPSLQQRGVAVDVAIPLPDDIRPYDTSSKPYALRFDEVPAAKYDKLDFGVTDLLRQSLSDRSAERRKKSPYFQDLGVRIAQGQSQPIEIYPLQLEPFLARQKRLAERETLATLPGIPEVKLDEIFTELLLISLDYASRRIYAQADKLYADRNYGEAVKTYSRAVEADPANATAGYKLAWSLATCPDRSLRDGSRASSVALKACEADGWKNWQFIFGLAVAEAEADDFDSAKKHLEQALAAAPAAQREAYRYLQQRFANRQKYASQ